MDTLISDTNTVGEVDAVMFSMIQGGSVSAMVSLSNIGSNTITYHWQEFNGTAWAEQALVPNTLTPSQVTPAVVTSLYPQVRLMACASGGALLDFVVTRVVTRVPGGELPILSI